MAYLLIMFVLELYVITNFQDVVVSTTLSFVARPLTIPAASAFGLLTAANSMTVPAPTSITGGTGVSGTMIAAGLNLSGKSYKAILFR